MVLSRGSCMGGWYIKLSPNLGVSHLLARNNLKGMICIVRKSGEVLDWQDQKGNANDGRSRQLYILCMSVATGHNQTYLRNLYGIRNQRQQPLSFACQEITH